MTTNNPHPTGTRIAQQIAVCDNVLARLSAFDDQTLEPLREDVRLLRDSLQATLSSMNGHRDGTGPPH